MNLFSSSIFIQLYLELVAGKKNIQKICVYFDKRELD